MLLTTFLGAGENEDENLRCGGQGADTEKDEEGGQRDKRGQRTTKRATRGKDERLEKVKLQNRIYGMNRCDVKYVTVTDEGETKEEAVECSGGGSSRCSHTLHGGSEGGNGPWLELHAEWF